MDFTLIFYFLFWFLGNYYYNIQNKNAANAANPHNVSLIIGTTQLAIGSIYAIFLWIAPNVRKFPEITTNDILRLIPLGFCFSISHISAVFSLTVGGIVFGQIVKASEPVFTAIIGTLFYNKKISIQKLLCLIPIILGVCIAALKEDENGKIEINFNVRALITAVLSNIFASFRGAENKKLLEDKEFMSRIGNVSNQFAIMIIISFFVSIPVVIYFEGNNINWFYNELFTNQDLFYNVLYSSLTFYAYNELSTMTLTKISQITNSIANTTKRVIVIIGVAIVFNESISFLKGLGCFICLCGVFVDSIIDDLIRTYNLKSNK